MEQKASPELLVGSPFLDLLGGWGHLSPGQSISSNTLPDNTAVESSPSVSDTSPSSLSTLSSPPSRAVSPSPSVSSASPAASTEDMMYRAFVESLPPLHGDGGEELQTRRVLGVGGMGQVELAEQVSLRREVAIKRIKPDNTNEKATRCLLHESLVSGALEHPNIIPVHLLGRDLYGNPGLVMRRVEGESWETLLQDPGHPIWKRRKTWSREPLIWHIDILMDICNAIDYAHSKGIVHRDIKPDNVMVGAYGEVYLLDWGLAVDVGHDKADAADSQRLLFPSSMGGTPSYLAPEMLLGDLSKIDVRTDVFLLGATLHRILVGSARHKGKTLQEVLFAAAMIMPYPYDESVPAELAEIANRATARDPAQRFPSVHAMREALADYLSHKHSNALCKGAQERFQQLRTLVQQEHIAPQLAQIIRRLFSECRFGFLQAIEAWEHNPVATTGLQDALKVMVGFEIGQGHLDHAVAWFGELKHPSRELSERLEGLHQTQLLEEQERRRMKELAFEMDMNVGRSSRSGLMAIAGLSIGVLALLLLLCIRMGWIEISYSILIGTCVVGLLALGGVSWRWRASLLPNTISRKFLYYISMCLGFMLVARMGGAALELPIHFVLLFEMLLFGVVIASAALMFTPLLFWGVFVCLIAFGMGVLWVDYMFEIFTFMCFFLWLFPAYAFRKERDFSSFIITERRQGQV